MNPYIFREYDIRGIVAEDFPDEVVELLGKGMGTYFREHKARSIALSGDIRLSTPHLKAVLAKGLLSTGLDIVDLGIVPTPVNYYSMYTLRVDGAVQITGSHNPANMNGFKVSLEQKAVFGDQIQAIRQIIEKGEFATGSGTLSTKELLEEYKQMIISKIKLARPLKIAMDCGNGAAALTAPEIFRAIGCDVKELYCDVDGRFPNHHPDPTVPKNLTDLIATVQEGGYDFGVSFDGDADRIGVVDDRGEIIWADYLMILFLEEVARPGVPVIFDVKCSQALEEMIVAHGGVPLIWKTGHSLIKQKMKDEHVPFAGEMSGHLFMGDEYFGYDDAVYVAARFARLISRSGEKLSAKTARLPHYFSTPEMRLECKDDPTKFRIARQAADYFKAHYECLEVDGVRIKFGDGWGLVRSSNTQPVIVTRFEAKTAERLTEIRDLVLNKLREFGEFKF
jgi:phosphomannomutase/phosphoglucomutase